MYSWNVYYILFYAVVEVGFLRDNYSVSEQPSLRDVTICVQINNGTLERAVDINFNVRDITAQSMCCEHFPVTCLATESMSMIVYQQEQITPFLSYIMGRSMFHNSTIRELYSYILVAPRCCY